MNSARAFFLVLAISIFALGNAFGAKTVYELTLKGKTCKEDTRRQQLDCDYKVGKSLRVSIAGVGQSDAAIAFMKSDYDGDFFGKVGILHGCVIVGRGGKRLPDDPLGFAFISPKNGKVYADWQECKAGY
jgi:hypothetical protein